MNISGTICKHEKDVHGSFVYCFRLNYLSHLRHHVAGISLLLSFLLFHYSFFLVTLTVLIITILFRYKVYIAVKFIST